MYLMQLQSSPTDILHKRLYNMHTNYNSNIQNQELKKWLEREDYNKKPYLIV